MSFLKLYLFQAHSGVKGVIRDVMTGQGISNAVIHVTNITREGKAQRRNSDIDHDITSGNLIISDVINYTDVMMWHFVIPLHRSAVSYMTSTMTSLQIISSLLMSSIIFTWWCDIPLHRSVVSYMTSIMTSLQVILDIDVIGHFLTFGDSHISELRPQNLECNFGLNWFRENGQMSLLHELYSLLLFNVVIWHSMVL